MLIHISMTDKAIRDHADKLSISELRSSQNAQLKLRYHKDREHGSWLIWSDGLWHHVATWPACNSRQAHAGVAEALIALASQRTASIQSERLTTVAELLDWYVAKISVSGHCGHRRQQDILSAIRCHLSPLLGHCAIAELDHYHLETQFMIPLHQRLAPATVSKILQILKAACHSAHAMQRLTTDPMATITLSDFGRVRRQPKGSALQPLHVPALLRQLREAPFPIKVLCLLQLTLGTRIGETCAIQWQHLELNPPARLYLPADTTKTRKAHTLPLPPLLVTLLQQWQQYLTQRQYQGPYLLPSANEKRPLAVRSAIRGIRGVSKGQWRSHDLRKCARNCWAEQGVDFMIAERQLNHSLGKVAEAYLDSQAHVIRLSALITHSQWLDQQSRYCYQLVDTRVTPRLIAYPTDVCCGTA